MVSSILLGLVACGRVGFGERVPPAADGGSPSARDAGTAEQPSDQADASLPNDGAIPSDAAAPTAGTAGADANTAGQGGLARAGAAGQGGSGGMSGAGSPAADGGSGVDVTQPIGDTGLRVADILGYYTGDWGDMVLRQAGSEIWGVYEHDSGTIVGQVTSDGVFMGWWSQLPTRSGVDAGEVEFRWSQTGSVVALDGRWRYGSSGEWLENWDIDLVTDRAAPSSLTSRFETASDFKRHP